MCQPNDTCVNPFFLGNGLSMIGGSIAAKATTFFIPEKKIMLDCGLPGKINEQRVDHIFITHGHMDHSGNLNQVLMANSNMKHGSRKVKIYIHNKQVEQLYEYIKATFAFSTNTLHPKITRGADKSSLMKGDVFKGSKIEIIPVSFGQKIEIEFSAQSKWIIDVIYCRHTVPCVGFGFSDVRTKLKEEYTHLTGPEIGALSKKGILVSETIEVPLFCYLGDTDHTIFLPP